MSTFWFPIFKFCWSTSTKWETESTKWVTKQQSGSTNQQNGSTNQQVGRPRINQGGRANYMGWGMEGKKPVQIVLCDFQRFATIKCDPPRISMNLFDMQIWRTNNFCSACWGFREFSKESTDEWIKFFIRFISARLNFRDFSTSNLAAVRIAALCTSLLNIEYQVY